jgi:hypothetical protein
MAGFKRWLEVGVLILPPYALAITVLTWLVS